ncbi:AtpZ/AtpI family protein [Thermomicrobium sp. 4228-Ro]|uniref:AtpZ/AtpI family protein n=1 Tax=Thermomicrobium sp. 4228-Ro TaxID=2993937 RepID=UPI002248D2B3|nr:AtpZ/AtpI family protein [Thermomicrobium sp. 4228-Ro]MCX2727495.1 AtpZ/AtpI family protein [Thermomicrobium sp. 4228-Ro]
MVRGWQTIGVALSLGFTVVSSLVLCIGGGVLLDRWLGTAPVLTLVGVVLGLVTAGYSFYQLAVLAGSRRNQRGGR